MAFFRKKEQTIEKETPKKAPQSLQEFVRGRVLTAEGWQRRTLSKAAAQVKKSK